MPWYTFGMEESTGTVTLEAFAARVGCHFTTASRLRAGERMPSASTLGRIVSEYGLDEVEVLKLYTEGDREKFGGYLRKNVFKTDEVEAVPAQTGVDA